MKGSKQLRINLQIDLNQKNPISDDIVFFIYIVNVYTGEFCFKSRFLLKQQSIVDKT